MRRSMSDLIKDQMKNNIKRAVAGVLAAAMIINYFPIFGSDIENMSDAYAATATDPTIDTSIDTTSEGIGTGSYNVVEEEATQTQAYRVNANADTTTFKPFYNCEEWKERSAIKAPNLVYSLTVATGATKGTKVLYFCINYKDTQNVSRKQFIFPHVDAPKKSESLLNYYYKNYDTDADLKEKNPNPYNGKYSLAFAATEQEYDDWYNSHGYCNYIIQDGQKYIFTWGDIDSIPDGKTPYYYTSARNMAVYTTPAGLASDIYDGSFGETVADSLDYKVEHLQKDALDSFTVQDYAFKTEAEIASVESIDVYIEQGSWTVQGMSVYKVNKYKGMEEYGLISGDTFLDFEGYLLADVQKSNPKSQLTIPTRGMGSDTITKIDKDTSDDCYIVNYDKDQKTKGYAADSSVYSFRMDFSDIYEGGIESFLNENADSMKSYEGIVEDISMEVQYKDIHGWTRKIELPVIISSYGLAMRNVGDKSILGFAQRGDTLAFQGLFPDFDSVVGEIEVKVGAKARTSLENGGIKIRNKTAAVQSKISELSNDDVNIAGISMYEGGCMPYIVDGVDTDGVAAEGATIQYKFESEYPFIYQTSDQMRGRKIKSDGSEKFKMSEYKSSYPLLAAQKGKDKFLVTITTSEETFTKETDNLQIKLYYLTDDGQKTNTVPYKAKEASNDYMGLWPDTKGDNFLDNSAIVAGGSVSFLVEATDFKEFVGCDITVLGENSWAMDNITIAYVQTYDSRMAYKIPVESAGKQSNFWVQRDSITAEFFSLKGTNYKVTNKNEIKGDGESDGTSQGSGKVQLIIDGVPQTDSEGNPILVDYDDVETTKTTGSQAFKPGDTYNISFGGDTDTDVRTISYSDVRYSMTYEQTQMDWNFFKAKKSYDIEVDVADDPDFDDGNGNSGSTNHFYFQLLFANGNSAYILANQQLSADGFRSGRQETFSIAINQDYGNLTGLRIVPEDVSEDADPFDKLNIDRITVSEQTKGGSYITYVIDKVGWIDIDYRDELESASSHGQRARTADELSKVYKVSYKERNVKLLCEVFYEPWSGSFGQFEGSVKAVIDYVTASDNTLKHKTVDVAKAMCDYQEVTAKSVEATTNPETQTKTFPPDGLGTYVDSKCMMRPNHTDRFFIPAISDLKSIKSITFTAKHVGEKKAQWNIGKISISQVLSDGELQIAENEEYVRNVTKKHLCINDNTDISYNTLGIGETTPIPTINFTYNEIVWSSEEWATPVTRVPESEDDVVNIFVYPSTGSKNTTGATMYAKLNYNIPFSGYKTTENAALTKITDGTGKEVYYKENIGASGFTGAGRLTVQCVAPGLGVDYAVVQHVRSGVVVGTYTYLFLDALASVKPYAEPANAVRNDRTTERFAILFGAGTETMDLSAMKNDVAIGFTYTSTIDDGTTEFQSPYVYLTDLGFTSVSEGTFADIEFDIPDVKEIKSYSIAAYGNLKCNVDGAAAQVNAVDPSYDEAKDDPSAKKTTQRSYASFKEEYALTSKLLPHKATSKSAFGRDSIAPVSITFKTLSSTMSSDNSTKPAVKMSFNFLTHLGTYATYTKEDITPYIEGDVKEFVTKTNDEGEEVPAEQTVNFFLTEMSEDLTVKSVVITPYNSRVEIEQEKASVLGADSTQTTIDTILNEAGNGEDINLNNKTSADLTKQILESRNAKWVIGAVSWDVAFGGNSKVRSDFESQEFSGLNTDEKNTLRLVNVSQIIDITKNDGTKQDVETGTKLSIPAKSGDKIKGNVYVIPVDNSGFVVKAYKMIGNAPEEVTDAIEKSTASFVFTVPENKTGSNVIYRLEIYPKDGPDLADIVEITVESDPVENASSTDASSTDSSTTNNASSGTTDNSSSGTTDNSSSSSSGSSTTD